MRPATTGSSPGRAVASGAAIVQPLPPRRAPGGRDEARRGAATSGSTPAGHPGVDRIHAPSTSPAASRSSSRS